MSTSADIRISFRADLTEGPVATIEVDTPAGTLVAMAEPRIDGRILHAGAIHLCTAWGSDRTNSVLQRSGA